MTNQIFDASLLALVLACSAAICPGQQFAPSAMLPGDATVTASAGNQLLPAIAHGGGLSLAVWEDDRSSFVDSVFGGQSAGNSQPGNFDIYGVLLDPLGQPVGPAPFVVNGDTWDQKNARVAWNGSDYLVVFESTKPTPSYYSQGIYAVRVSAGGVVLDPVPIRVDDDPDQDERRPVVASLGGRWLVAWNDVDAAGNGVAQSAFVDALGTVGSKQVLASGWFLDAPTDLALVASSSQYVLAYSVGSPYGVWAARFDTNAVGLGAAFLVAPPTARRPAIASDATDFYVAWLQGPEIRGTPITATGSVVVPGGVALMAADGSNSHCAVGFDGQQWVVATDVSPSIWATQVSPSGAAGSPLVLSTSSRSVDDVAIGNGAGGTIVLWTDRRTTPNNFGTDPTDVFGTTLFSGGSIGADAPISVSPPAQVHAGLAGSPADGFLLVYKSLDAGVTRIMAHALDAQGNSLGQPFLIHSDDRSIDWPDVAWNGSEYLVAWQHRLSLASNGPPTQIEGRRCLADGTLLDPAPVVIMEGFTPSVAAVGGTFLVAAPYHHQVLQSNSVIRFRRIDGSSGAFLDASPTVITFGAGPIDVVGMSDRWLMMWGNGTGAQVLANGVPLAPFYAFDTGASSTRFHLAVNAAGDEAVVAYQYRSSLAYRSDIRMRRFALNGSSPDPLLGPLVAGQNQAQLRPTVAALDDEYLCMWADHRDVLDYEPGLGDVYAARLGPQGNLLDPNGIAVLDSAPAAGGATAIRTARGSALYVASMVLEGAFGTHRLVAGTYRNAATTPWSSVGAGVAGSLGEPVIEGYGPLLPQTAVELTLRAAAPNSIGALALGLSQVNVPLFGGVLVPAPEAIFTMLIGPAGTGSFTGTWPGATAGTSLYGQFWVLDATAPQDFAATAGLRGVVP
jgi:hypothetical protein